MKRFAANRIVGPVAASLALACLSHTQETPVIQVNVKPRTLSGLKINEIQFDPGGLDGGNEWIELYNKRSNAINVNNAKLKDHNGVVLATLPNLSLPAGTHYVVHLGPTVNDLIDLDLSDGDGNFFTNAAPADRLDNDAGGIYLTLGSALYDAVFWGTGAAPSGSGYSLAVSKNQWARGDYVELAIASGHGIAEGSTLGRDIDSSDTRSSADFMLDGGPNGAYPTPGTRNGLFLFSEGRAIHWTQAVVQELMSVVSTANQMGLSVTFASHANLVVTDPDLDGGFTIDADHSFNVTYQGSAKTMVGSLHFDYVRDGTPGATSYTATASGTITSLDSTLSMNFSYAKSESGFHSLTRVLGGLTAFTWTDNGQSYSYNSNSTVATTQSAQGTWDVTDNRAFDDWGSLKKTATGTQTLTKVSDGVYHMVAKVSQTSPPPPPSFGEIQYLFGSETLDFEADVVFDSDLGVTRTITRMDKATLDSGGYMVVSAELVKPATYSVTRFSGDTLSPLGVFDLTMDETIRFGYPTPDPNDPGQNYLIADQLTRELTPGGEFVQRGVVSGPGGSLTYYIDAPVAQQVCGCGCGGSGCSCGGPDEEDGTSVGDVVGIGIGVGTATGVCTWGTIVTTPAVVTGAGAVLPAGIAAGCATAGAVWWLTWEWWHD